MRYLICLAVLLGAGPLLASDFIPVEGGITWNYEAREPATGTRTHTMGGAMVWNSMLGHPQVEMENGTLTVTTHWSLDDAERLILQGMDHGSVPAGGTWYFSPSPVFADPGLAPDETVTTTAGVYEVTDSGDQWYGERQVVVECLDAFVINLPGFGNLQAVELAVSWPDSPAAAPWTYGRHETRLYCRQMGVCTITVTADPGVIWDLVSVEGIVTDVPAAAPLASMVAAPTPFNPATTFKLNLPQPCLARLEIFDLRGRKLNTLLEAPLGAGNHEIPWRPLDLASGVYLARLQAGGTVVSARATLLK